LLTAVVVAGLLLAGIGVATPALAQPAPITLLCSPGTNGGTLVNGVCVLPAAEAGHPYEGFLLTSNGAVDTFTITAGSLPPGLSMPPTYGAAGTIIGGQGTFTFSVHVTPFGASTPSTNGPYSITVGPPPPLAITFPSTCCTAGTAGTAGGRWQPPARRGADRWPPGRHADGGRHVHGHRQRRGPGHRTGHHYHLPLTRPHAAVQGVIAGLFLAGSGYLWVSSFRAGWRDGADAARQGGPPASFARVASVSFGVVFLAEWGDITQVAVANLAARYGPACGLRRGHPGPVGGRRRSGRPGG
jgi:hypothetical protein